MAESKANNMHDEDDEDDYDDDPWEAEGDRRESSSPSKKHVAAQPDKKEMVPVQNKPNPFDTKVKPAFDDLEDELKFDGFGIEPKNAKLPEIKKNDVAKNKKNDEDNGLFVDNDFGDDFEEEEEDAEEEHH